MTPSRRRRAGCRVRVAGDVVGGALQDRKQGLFGVAEEVEASDGAAFDEARLGETVEGSDTSREVVQTGEVFEVAAVATEQDVTQVGKAVDVLFDGSEGVACRTLLMFYLAVVLESGDVVGGGLDRPLLYEHQREDADHKYDSRVPRLTSRTTA